MMNKTESNINYLDKIPTRRAGLAWSTDENDMVTLETENRGVFNRIAQKLFKKPRISYIHLDGFGSFVWQIIDGKKSILELGEAVEARFGETAHPLYERLAKYFQILDSYGFISFK